MKIIKVAKTFIAYHGTPNKSLDGFDISFSGNGHDQEGPGIYFTSDESDARSYSNGSLGKVIKVKLNLRKTVPRKGGIKADEASKLILLSLGLNSEMELDDLSEEKFYDSALSNFGEDAYTAFHAALSSFIRFSTSPHDGFQSIWHDLYRNDPKSYLNGMVVLGYDGVVIPKDGLDHYVVFNPLAIEIIGNS